MGVKRGTGTSLRSEPVPRFTTTGKAAGTGTGPAQARSQSLFSRFFPVSYTL
jgi:hypothetical protein